MLAPLLAGNDFPSHDSPADPRSQTQRQAHSPYDHVCPWKDDRRAICPLVTRRIIAVAIDELLDLGHVRAPTRLESNVPDIGTLEGIWLEHAEREGRKQPCQ